MVIWKYELEVLDIQFIDVPIGGTILSVANQSDRVMLWAMVNPTNPKEKRRIEIYGTGHNIEPTPADRTFIGTVLVAPYVWHVFERN